MLQTLCQPAEYYLTSVGFLFSDMLPSARYMKDNAVELDGIAMLIFGMCITSFNRWLLGQKDWESVILDVPCPKSLQRPRGKVNLDSALV